MAIVGTTRYTAVVLCAVLALELSHSPVEGCNETYTTASGMLVSPTFPAGYPSYANCFYHIQSESSSVIHLVFTSFDIEISVDKKCIYDYVDIHDGKDARAPTIGRYCGQDLPGPILSSTNQLWLNFRSDLNTNGEGFRAMYSTVSWSNYCDHAHSAGVWLITMGVVCLVMTVTVLGCVVTHRPAQPSGPQQDFITTVTNPYEPFPPDPDQRTEAESPIQNPHANASMLYHRNDQGVALYSQ